MYLYTLQLFGIAVCLKIFTVYMYMYMEAPFLSKNVSPHLPPHLHTGVEEAVVVARGVQQALVGEGHGQLPREGPGRPVQGRNLLGEEGGHWATGPS